MICTLRHITVWICGDGTATQYSVDPTGLEKNIDYPLQVGSSKTEGRFYRCDNCNREWDGSETFDAIRDHIGHYNQPLIPFTSQALED